MPEALTPQAIQQTLWDVSKLVQDTLGTGDLVKAVSQTATPWFNVVREDLEDLIYVAAPKDAPLSTRFNRIQGEGTWRCPNAWQQAAARIMMLAAAAAICRKSRACRRAVIARQ